MFVEGTLRWQVTEDCPWDLLMALCLREFGGIAEECLPDLPGITPPVVRTDRSNAPGTAAVTTIGKAVVRPSPGAVTARPAASADQAVLSEQWMQWWSQIVRRDMRPLITGLRPPHFAEFDRLIELQDLIIDHYAAASAWTAQRHDEYARTSIEQHAARAADIVDIVRDREHLLRRQAGYFRLDIAVLPLATAGAWIVGPNSIVVSDSLRNESVAFRTWFAPLVEALV